MKIYQMNVDDEKRISFESLSALQGFASDEIGLCNFFEGESLTLTITTREMSQEEFEAMPEWEG